MNSVSLHIKPFSKDFDVADLVNHFSRPLPVQLYLQERGVVIKGFIVYLKLEMDTSKNERVWYGISTNEMVRYIDGSINCTIATLVQYKFSC